MAELVKSSGELVEYAREMRISSLNVERYLSFQIAYSLAVLREAHLSLFAHGGPVQETTLVNEPVMPAKVRDEPVEQPKSNGSAIEHLQSDVAIMSGGVHDYAQVGATLKPPPQEVKAAEPARPEKKKWGRK